MRKNEKIKMNWRKATNKIVACILVASLAVPVGGNMFETVKADEYDYETVTQIYMPGGIRATLDDGTLTIEGNGPIRDYTEDIDAPWMSHSYEIKNVIIKYGITRIGNRAFEGCSNLTNITIPESVVQIGDRAFYNSGITGIEGMNRVESIGDYAFASTNLKEFTFPDSTKALGNYMFYKCMNLKTINISKSVEHIEDAFLYRADNVEALNVAPDNEYYCSDDGIVFDKAKTKILHYPNGKSGEAYAIPENVNTVGNYAFLGQKYIKEVVIGKNVKKLGYGAFMEMKSLQTMTVPTTVKSVGIYLLEGNNSLISVNFNASVKKVPGNMCTNCKALKKVSIKNKKITTISLKAFQGCKKLTKVTLPSKLKTIDCNAFYGCKSLKKISWPKKITKIRAGAFSKTKIKKYPKGIYNNENGEYVKQKTVTVSGKNMYKESYKVLSILNKERKKYGLKALKMDKELLNAAMIRAAEQTVLFSHTRPNGTTCFSASDRMFGENIAMGQPSATVVMNAWMNSPGHRQNILNPGYRIAGIGCFKKNGTLYWVQCFGMDKAKKAKKKNNKSVKVKVPVKK